MRSGIINEVRSLMKKNRNSYFLTGDLGFHTLEPIEEEFSQRFINVGVAEQNMIGIAAGLALSGKKVFCYSIVPFLTMRCFEQIRNDICFHDLDVVLLGAGSGLSYGILSNSHFALEDVAILRTLPNMTIFSPADEIEGILGIKALEDYHHPVYVRIGLRTEPVVYAKPYDFILGKGKLIQDGKDFAVFVTGNLANEVKKAAEIINNKTQLSTAIIDIHTIKPLDEKIIVKYAKDKKVVFVVEEHGIIGGLGEAVGAVISEKLGDVRVVKIGMDNHYIETVGNRDYLRKRFGLDASGIAATMEKYL